MLVAICDDSVDMRYSMKKHLSSYASRNKTEIEIIEYRNGEELLEKFSFGVFSIIFLDIEMGEKRNGIEVARRIWEIDKLVAVVFITGHDKYMQSAYETHPFHYIIKPISREKVDLLLDEYQVIFRQHETFLTFRNFEIRMHSIIYIEKTGDMLFISSDEREFIVRGTLYKISELLDDTFIRCHKCYIINMGRILDINFRDRENEVNIIGCSFPISIGGKFLNDFKRAYANYGKKHWRYRN
jgi:DNA-binding LytR/AlgR family response regulator